MVTLGWQACGEEIVLLSLTLINCGKCHLFLQNGSHLSGDLKIICQVSLSALWTWGKGVKCCDEKVHHIHFSEAGKQSDSHLS